MEMAIKDLLDVLDNEISVINGTDFDIEFTETPSIPDYSDPNCCQYIQPNFNHHNLST